MRWQLRTKRVAALPGLATLAPAGAVAIGDVGRAEKAANWDYPPGYGYLTVAAISAILTAIMPLRMAVKSPTPSPPGSPSP